MIASDIQKLSPGDIVDLFELDATALGGGVTRYYAGNVADGVYSDLVWQGQTYVAFPLMASGFSLQTQGTLPRPHVRIANVSGLIGAELQQYDDLVGAKVTRRRTLVKYLDAVNWTSGVNLLPAPGDLTDPTWQRLIGTTLAGGVTSTIPGGLSLDRITDQTLTDFGGVYQNLTVPNDLQSYVISFYVLKTAGGTAPTFGANLWLLLGSTEVRKNVRINTDSGAELNGVAGITVTDAGNARRFAVTLANNASGNTLLRVSLYPALGPNAWTSDDASTTGSAVCGAVQVEKGTVATAYGPYWSTPDPTAHWPDEVWYIDRKVVENKVFIEFELVAAWDVTGVLLPRRQCTQNICSWRYRGEGCGYAGPAVAKADDTPTSILSEDRCGKRLSSCALRFPTGDIPYGGFPGVNVIPQL